jgi:hypothetical protein
MSLGSWWPRIRTEYTTPSASSPPSAAAAGRSRAGTTSCRQSTSAIAAVAWPLGQLAVSVPGTTGGSASAGLRSCVVRFEPRRIAATAIAIRGARRASAPSTSAAENRANGPGSARCDRRLAHSAVPGRERPRKPSNVRWSIASKGAKWYAVSQMTTADSAHAAAAAKGAWARRGGTRSRLPAALKPRSSCRGSD